MAPHSRITEITVTPANAGTLDDLAACVLKSRLARERGGDSAVISLKSNNNKLPSLTVVER